MRGTSDARAGIPHGGHIHFVEPQSLDTGGDPLSAIQSGDSSRNAHRPRGAPLTTRARSSGDAERGAEVEEVQHREVGAEARRGEEAQRRADARDAADAEA